jgi:hypothetical protein
MQYRPLCCGRSLTGPHHESLTAAGLQSRLRPVSDRAASDRAAA